MNINLTKKILKSASIIFILLSITIFKGCNDVKVLEEDISLNNENNNSKVSITKIKDPFEDRKDIFKGYYIDDGKVYGRLYPGKSLGVTEWDYDIPYTLDENGIFSKVELNEPWLEDHKKLLNRTNSFYKGIYTEGYPNTHEELKEKSYFIDIKNENKFLLENHKNYEKIIKENMSNGYKEIYIEENFYLERTINFFGFDKESELYKEKEDRKNQFLLVDITNEKEYISDAMEDMPYVFFYEKEKSFMTINDKGIIYKLVVKNEKIEKEEYSILPLKEYNLESLEPKEGFTKIFKKNNFLVFTILDIVDYKTLVLDINTWEFKIHENVNILMDEDIKMDNSNLFIT
ncbi:hypothetical protein, partial [Clostridium sp.]|uniref:hypothetical protein n=1 Tax=Clostridium sp. TaxID=1506 RepID=UPI002632B414